MQCPKCANTMARVAEPAGQGAPLHPHCNGLWFDMLAPRATGDDFAEADRYRQRRAGPAKYNRVDRIDCPACAGERTLIRMVDPQQPHIWFESCQNCFGRFYDAGEFTDFTEHGFLEWVKRPGRARSARCSGKYSGATAAALPMDALAFGESRRWAEAHPTPPARPHGPCIPS